MILTFNNTYVIKTMEDQNSTSSLNQTKVTNKRLLNNIETQKSIKVKSVKSATL